DQAVERGRALFRSPAILGGPAARAGLSCNACHSGGTRDPRVFLPGLTDRPGAARGTSELSGKGRGGWVGNPVDIPDLYGVPQRTTFGHVRDPSLAHFIHGVIVDEFQGHEPQAAVTASLVAYLRALDEGECERGMAAVTLASSAEDVRRAVAAAE